MDSALGFIYVEVIIQSKFYTLCLNKASNIRFW